MVYKITLDQELQEEVKKRVVTFLASTYGVSINKEIKKCSELKCENCIFKEESDEDGCYECSQKWFDMNIGTYVVFKK